MGRGDKKSKKGKIFMGSFGKKRPKQTRKLFVKENPKVKSDKTVA